MHLVVFLNEQSRDSPCGLGGGLGARFAYSLSCVLGGFELAAPEWSVFAHELGHSMGLSHERYQLRIEGGDLNLIKPYPYSVGYVNEEAFKPEDQPVPERRCWSTIMAYGTRCWKEGGFRFSTSIPRFSNPYQTYLTYPYHDPLGIPGDEPSSNVDGPADARRSLNETGGIFANYRPALANRPPQPVGSLAPVTIGVDEPAVSVEAVGAFRDPDGDVLTYGAVSSAPAVASVSISGSTVTVTPVEVGTAVVTVTATDTGGSNTAATQTFTVRVLQEVARPFTDHRIVPGVTPVKAVHFTELRTRIDGLRAGAGLPQFPWTDPVLTVGVTPVRLAHLLELRAALAAAYSASGRSVPGWTDAAPVAGATRIRAAHLMELRAAVMALE